MAPFSFCLICLSVFVLLVGMIFFNLNIPNSFFDALFLLKNLTSTPKNYSTRATDEMKLLEICVLSARRNFEARQAIRESWMDILKRNEKLSTEINIHFVIGQPCEVHPNNRLDVFGCHANKLFYTEERHNVPLISAGELNTELSRSEVQNIFNISLSVNHPIVIGRLGLNAAVHLKNSSTKVILYDYLQDEEISSARFSIQDPGIVIDGYRYQSVEAVLLPKDFQGSLRVVTDQQLSPGASFLSLQQWKINNYGGALTIRGEDEDKFIDANFTNSVLLPSLLGSIFDADTFNNRVKEQYPLNQVWNEEEENVTDRLTQEQKIHSDILFINVTDVYRNLPLKLLRFHKWLNSEADFTVDFVLKTDDDCYLDLETIVSQLVGLKGIKKLWWSNFRDDWFVETYGKWAEKEYRGTFYPRFACGTGNIVSSDISQWLALNFNYLKCYQGEDVSMGIWLSAVAPNFIVDTAWHCEKSCSRDAIAIPELTPFELQEMWKSKFKCNNPCGCDN